VQVVHIVTSPSGAIKGNVISTDVDVSGTLAEKADIKEFLLVRASGRVEGLVNCGDVQVERGAELAGGIFSVYSAAAEVRPVNDNVPAAAPAEMELAPQASTGRRSTRPNRLSQASSLRKAHRSGHLGERLLERRPRDLHVTGERIIEHDRHEGGERHERGKSRGHEDLRRDVRRTEE
jgi:Polymer-forming cytoskeletal